MSRKSEGPEGRKTVKITGRVPAETAARLYHREVLLGITREQAIGRAVERWLAQFRGGLDLGEGQGGAT